ncbi:hypothetical protein SNE40_011764 [Patella caerulea]|uniref:Chromo domain-containing protein n=1 Tax=Patella caerulea TaxID=87958 RepID=A0AAN8JLY8_PATCE
MEQIIPSKLAQMLKVIAINSEPHHWRIENESDKVSVNLTWVKQPQIHPSTSTDLPRVQSFNECGEINEDTNQLGVSIISETVDQGTESYTCTHSSGTNHKFLSDQTSTDRPIQALKTSCPKKESHRFKIAANEGPEIEQVWQKKINHSGAIEYLIKWRNRPTSENTWLIENRLDKDLRDYLKTQKIPGPVPDIKRHKTYLPQPAPQEKLKEYGLVSDSPHQDGKRCMINFKFCDRETGIVYYQVERRIFVTCQIFQQTYEWEWEEKFLRDDPEFHKNMQPFLLRIPYSKNMWTQKI